MEIKHQPLKDINFTREDLFLNLLSYRDELSHADERHTPSDQLTAELCRYLARYLHDTQTRVEHDFTPQAMRFRELLPGLLIRALQALEQPDEDDGNALEFFKNYNDIGRDTFPGWQEVKSLALVDIDDTSDPSGGTRRNERLGFMYSLNKILHTVLPRQVCASCEDYLDADVHALEMHFQRFLHEVWELKGAREKHTQAKKRALTGVFGRTRFTTWEGIGFLLFQFNGPADLGDSDQPSLLQTGYKYLNFRTYSSSPEGYNAAYYSGCVSLAEGLGMINDVRRHFNLEEYAETSEWSLFPGL